MTIDRDEVLSQLIGENKKRRNRYQNSDLTRVMKKIRERFEIYRGDWSEDGPSEDKLLNFCVTADQLRSQSWFLWMGRHRAGLELGEIIRKPTLKSGKPATALKKLESDLMELALDSYADYISTPDQVGVVFRMGDKGLFIYSMRDFCPDLVNSINLCVGLDKEDDSNWRSIFTFEEFIQSV